MVHERVTNDISATQGYLAQIKDGVVTENKINTRVTDFKNKVEIKMGELEAEIKMMQFLVLDQNLNRF